MKFALVGVGRWGQTIIKTLKQLPTAQLVATCSRSPSSLPPELQIAPHFLSCSEMMDNVKCDTVIIATHPNSHFQLARLALWRGANVICEKPCLLTETEMWDIQSDAKPQVFFTDYTNLYHRVIDKMQNLIYECPSRFKLSLMNSGAGPIRDGYSDLWDYGSHVASVILHLFPHEFWRDVSFGKDAVGNHTLVMTGDAVDVHATFGNKSSKRIHSFELVPYTSGHSVYWENDRSENPLLEMLKEFEKGKVATNIDLSLRVRALLQLGEPL
jgi:predicted dehydrogenase